MYRYLYIIDWSKLRTSAGIKIPISMDNLLSAFEYFRPLMLYNFITGQLLVENGFAQHYNRNRTRIQFIPVFICLVWYSYYAVSVTYFVYSSTQFVKSKIIIGIIYVASEGLFLFLWLFLSRNLIVILNIIDEMQQSLSKFTGQQVHFSTVVPRLAVALLIGMHVFGCYMASSVGYPVWSWLAFTYAANAVRRQILIISVFYFVYGVVIRDCRRYLSLNLHTMTSNDYYSLVHYCHLVVAQSQLLRGINKLCNKLVLLLLFAQVYNCIVNVQGSALVDNYLYLNLLELLMWTGVDYFFTFCFNMTSVEFHHLAQEVLTLTTKSFSKRNTKNVRVLLAAVGCGEKELLHLDFVRISPSFSLTFLSMNIGCLIFLVQNITKLRQVIEGDM